MLSLIDAVPDAREWVDREKEAASHSAAFSRFVAAVLWTNAVDADGEAVVDADPATLVSEINASSFPMFRGHDVGFPVGRVLAAKAFFFAPSTRFIAGVVGLYDDQDRVTFESLGVDSLPSTTSPWVIDPMGSGCHISFGVDAREVDDAWTDSVLADAPLPVERISLSHNAGEPQAELIRIGLVYLALVWNPFVTAVASEAGKKAYAALHDWLSKLWSKVAERRNPVVVIQSHQRDCEVTFVFRGKDVLRLFAAHEKLPLAAAAAAKLIDAIYQAGRTPSALVYEFEGDADRWYPSYALLVDGQLVSDRSTLVALQEAPLELSLGIQRGGTKPQLPRRLPQRRDDGET